MNKVWIYKVKKEITKYLVDYFGEEYKSKIVKVIDNFIWIPIYQNLELINYIEVKKYKNEYIDEGSFLYKYYIDLKDKYNSEKDISHKLKESNDIKLFKEYINSILKFLIEEDKEVILNTTFENIDFSKLKGYNIFFGKDMDETYILLENNKSFSQIKNKYIKNNMQQYLHFLDITSFKEVCFHLGKSLKKNDLEEIFEKIMYYYQENTTYDNISFIKKDNTTILLYNPFNSTHSIQSSVISTIINEVFFKTLYNENNKVGYIKTLVSNAYATEILEKMYEDNFIIIDKEDFAEDKLKNSLLVNSKYIKEVLDIDKDYFIKMIMEYSNGENNSYSDLNFYLYIFGDEGMDYLFDLVDVIRNPYCTRDIKLSQLTKTVEKVKIRVNELNHEKI